MVTPCLTVTENPPSLSLHCWPSIDPTYSRVAPAGTTNDCLVTPSARSPSPMKNGCFRAGLSVAKSRLAAVVKSSAAGAAVRLGWSSDRNTPISALIGIFSASFVAAKELFNIFLVITFMTALLNALKTLQADVRMVQPFRRVMRGGHSSFLIIALCTYVISLFFWPTPAVPLVSAILLPAAIAVALPGKVSYCFDAAECRLRYAWTGGFIDGSPYWKGNGSSQAAVTGEIVYRETAPTLGTGKIDMRRLKQTALTLAAAG